MGRKKGITAAVKPLTISREVAERIRSDQILLKDEARLVCELARSEGGSPELLAHADSLARLLKSHLSLVEGVLDAVAPEGR